MRRFVCLLAGVLLVVPSLGSDAPKKYDGATVDELEGTWQMVAVDDGGGPGALPPVGTQTFRAGTWARSFGGSTDTGTYTTDTSHVPAYLTETYFDQDGKAWTLYYIFRIDGDTLKIARYGRWKPRPKRFDEENLFTVVWRRVKK